MGAIGSILKQALKEAAPQAKRGAKGALEVPRETPVPKTQMPEQPMVEDVAPVSRQAQDIETIPAKVDDAVDEQARRQLDPQIEKPVIDPVPIAKQAEIERAALKIDEPVEVQRVLSTNLDQFDTNDAWQPNFDTFETTDDVTGTIAAMADRNKASIQEARRDVVTDEQLKHLAAEMNVDGSVVQKVLERSTGQPMNAETIIATRQFINRSGERIVALAKMVQDPAQASDKVKLQFRRQIELHKEVMDSFMGARAETGRTLRAFGIPVGDDVEQLKYMNDVIDTVHGRDINKLADAFANMENMEGVNKMVKQWTKSKVLGVIEEVFINSILSGIKTHVVNITGNILFPAKGMVETAVAARMGKFLPGEDHVMVGEAQAEIYGYLSSVGDGWRMAAKAFRYGQESDAVTKFEQHYPQATSSQNLEIGGSLLRVADFFNLTIPKWMPKFADQATDAVGTAIRVPTERMLSPMDEFFKTMARRGHIAREAFREANGLPPTATNEQIAETIRNFIENPPAAVSQGADDMALYRTFQTPLGKVGKQFTNIVNRVPGLKILAPFIRTPTNIFKAAFAESTPFGLMSKNFKMRQDIAAGGARRDMALARLTVGSSTAALAGMYAASGTITGAGPSNFKAKSALRASGWQPYSIKVLNPMTGEYEYHSYQRAEPLAYIIGSVADMTEMLQWHDYDADDEQEEVERADKLAASIVGAIAENTMNKTFLTGISSFIEAMSDPDRYAKSWLESLGGAMIPYSALRRDLSKLQDDNIREAWTFSDKLKKSSGIPGWSDELPMKTDLYGDPINHPAGDLLGIFSPFPTSKETSDPVKLEVARVMQETRTVPLTKPSKRINGVKLSVEEYANLVELSRKEVEIDGMNFMESMSDLIESDAYIDATPDMKSHMLHITQVGYDNLAKRILVDDNDELQDKVFERKVNKIEKLQGEGAGEALFGGR